VLAVARGEVFFSAQVYALMRKYVLPPGELVLTPRQLQALSLCSAYPGEAGNVLAKQMGITYSTFRNLLSTSYVRLGVSNRAEAILKARSLGLITPGAPSSGA
jgi:DNA-binding CsgD family transcriptional regulator